MTDEPTTEQVQQGTEDAPAAGNQIDQQTQVDPPENKLNEAERFYNNSGPALEVPLVDEPEDEDMKAIRSDWTMYPAEVEKMVSHDLFDRSIGQEFEGVRIDRKTARTAVAELRAIVGDLGVNREEFGDLKEAVTQRANASVQADDPTTLREEAVTRLNREHGESAAEAFRAARAYVAKNPRLARFLDRSGLGDDPTTVATIARRALALQRAGKLRFK